MTPVDQPCLTTIPLRDSRVQAECLPQLSMLIGERTHPVPGRQIDSSENMCSYLYFAILKSVYFRTKAALFHHPVPCITPWRLIFLAI